MMTAPARRRNSLHNPLFFCLRPVSSEFQWLILKIESHGHYHGRFLYALVYNFSLHFMKLGKALVKLEAIEQTYDQSITLVKCANLQARLAEFLIYSCRADPSGKARCVGFNAITQWIVSELQSDEKSSRIGEAISVAVLSLFSDDVSVARFACSTLRCCVKLIPQLLEYSTLLVESTITALALVTSKLLVSNRLLPIVFIHIFSLLYFY